MQLVGRETAAIHGSQLIAFASLFRNKKTADKRRRATSVVARIRHCHCSTCCSGLASNGTGLKLIVVLFVAAYEEDAVRRVKPSPSKRLANQFTLSTHHLLCV
jgi:hypothetical protein